MIFASYHGLYYVGMHIDVVPNRGSPPTVLLRESYREGSKVRKRTLANLSSLSAAQIEAIRAALRGEALQPVAQSLRDHGLARARPRASRALSHAAVGLRVAARRQALPRARPGAGDGGRAHPGAAHQAGHHALVAHHDAGRGLRRGRCERGRSVRGDGLAARAPGRDREEARRAPPERRRPGALRPVLELLRGQQLPAGEARLQPRRQEGHAAGQLRPAHRCARLPGGGLGVRGQCRRQPDLAARGQAAARGLRHRAAGDGGRPRHDLQQGHRGDARDATAWPGSPRSRARRSARWSSRGSCSWACSTSAICSNSARRTTRASGWWRAAIRSWPSCARTSARSCSRPPSATSRRSRPGWMPASSSGSDEIGVRVGRVDQPVQGGQALRAGHRRQHLHLRAQARGHRRRGGAGRHLHHPHLGARRRRWTRPTACATTSRWPTSSARSARSRRSI